MEKYQTLFFDVDDTLLNFAAAERDALRLLFANYQLPFTSEHETHYKTINQKLWQSYENGQMSREQVLNTRFSLLLETYGQQEDGRMMETKYRHFLEKGHELMEGAFELISNLHHHHDLYIVTNGVSTTQYKRLRSAKLDHFFKDIFVSEDTGYQKPMKAFFDYVFARIPHFSDKKGLIIGDSLTADIKGGQQAGLDTCWFNPSRKHNETTIHPTYEIHHLEELYPILK
ncbi:noncanonical pyrimidine nucleotidase, YjjG family [Hazenella sp. IB182357]|uniref:Noncanonical pyrimidine nucleotidase, YjjG family n=1 Tax=Polycladospora coralii TaxID=2771432 RepID=A0A926RUP8_9BACL|nr:YjjG family noncanonical pyrimidine nucleotidase [Polycladospora coralii]MBD1373243.1 noncanonical pyrimidine nucleotidase, YjjG family [Polycladospora coralii]